MNALIIKQLIITSEDTHFMLLPDCTRAVAGCDCPPRTTSTFKIKLFTSFFPSLHSGCAFLPPAPALMASCLSSFLIQLPHFFLPSLPFSPLYNCFLSWPPALVSPSQPASAVCPCAMSEQPPFCCQPQCFSIYAPKECA